MQAGWRPGCPASSNARRGCVRHAETMSVRCVIVDDNPDFLRAASDLVERDGITVVGVASTGAQALRACRQLLPDVVLLDIQLGEETGFEVARLLAGEPDPGRPRHFGRSSARLLSPQL